ncbi:MAG: endonuclease/exonuclease/phosphatase family protein [Acidobacteria bacterium]|nr:endonuclease/exonuclease/phosphatase family protein [Acidobacteriota bacterium]MCA1607972.1 endonuclease/exonuclease/phosphatase family protein [Acidobacteriota bacterium]
MTPLKMPDFGSPAILDHKLNQYFPELLRFESTPELEKTELWQQIKQEVERVLNAVVQESVQSADFGALPSSEERAQVRNLNRVKAAAWNIERGSQFEGIVDALTNHADLKRADVLLLTELDYGMARSRNRFVARDLARRLNLNFAFAPVYIALQKGSGVEEFAKGENTNSIHGLAMCSRYPLKNVHAVPLPNGKDKMWGKEKRLGYLRALFAEIAHPAGEFRAVTVHLDAHCSRAHRHRQMKIILDHLDTLSPMPTLIGGDWNTTTFNAQNATRAIAGYWRRVAMGVKNVAENHYPHPDRYFEKDLFLELETRGYDYKSFNEIGVGTIHYDVKSIEKNTNLRDWVPEWCFPFIFWAANRVGGQVSGRLDWFAGKDIELAPGSTPRTVGDLVDRFGVPLSDHDAIVLDFRLA